MVTDLTETTPYPPYFFSALYNNFARFLYSKPVDRSSRPYCTRRGGALIVASAIAFYSVYTPLHLLTEHHCWQEEGHSHDATSSHAEHCGVPDERHDHPDHHAHHADHEEAGQDSQHPPHPASDHQILLSTLRDRTVTTDLTLCTHNFLFFEVAPPSTPTALPLDLPGPRKILLSSPRHIRAPPLI